MRANNLGLFFTAVFLLSANTGHAQEESAEPAPAEAKPGAEEVATPDAPRVLIMDLKNNGVAEKTVNTLQGVITVQISDYDALDVISGEDVRQLVALQAERQNTGCSDDGSCMAEIAGALGASLVVFGNVGQLGELLVVNLNLFNVDLAQSQGRVTIESPNLESFPGQLKPKIYDLLSPKMTELGFKVPERPEEVPIVLTQKELPPEDNALLGWRGGALLGGAILLLGSGGSGYWYTTVASEIESLETQKAVLEESGEVLNALALQGDIEALEPTQSTAMAVTIATGVLGVAGLGLGIFWQPPKEEAPSEE